jgi:hypothetical protein
VLPLVQARTLCAGMFVRGQVVGRKRVWQCDLEFSGLVETGARWEMGSVESCVVVVTVVSDWTGSFWRIVASE